MSDTLVPPRPGKLRFHLPGGEKSCPVAFRAGTSRQVRLLAALAIFAASVAAAPVSATAQNSAVPLDPADCSNGTWVDEPKSKPGLVEDCKVLVAISNHFASNLPDPYDFPFYNPWWALLGQRIGDDDRVTQVKISNIRGVIFTGEIPAELGKLTNLESLVLSGNQLTGEIPPELANLTNLRELELGHSALVPARYEIGGDGGNRLTGEIPAELGKLTNLGTLDLSGNQLTGEIPAEIANLTNLAGLLLSDNRLTGEIPAELGNLGLGILDLSGNRLTGEIPAEIGKTSRIQSTYGLGTLDLSGNRLTGEIPAELVSRSGMRHLDLSDNQLTGEIPQNTRGYNLMDYLDLSNNRLTGEIPAEPRYHGSYMDLSRNRLTGEIPVELANVHSLNMLFLYGNQLTGEIPAELGKLSALNRFEFCPNRLTGSLPSQLHYAARYNFFGDPDDISGCFRGRFSDDADSVHEDSIEQIAQWGITTGCEENRFCPQRTVNRSQMSAFLYRAVTHLHRAPDPGGEVRLSDVADDAWYRTNAQWAVNNGVMRAPGGSFNPRGAVTRADMAEMLVAAFDHISAPARAQGLFSDTAGFSDAAVRAMEGIRAAGVTAGCATNPLRYCPAETVTRAQMASFLTRAIQAAGS